MGGGGRTDPEKRLNRMSKKDRPRTMVKNDPENKFLVSSYRKRRLEILVEMVLENCWNWRAMSGS